MKTSFPKLFVCICSVFCTVSICAQTPYLVTHFNRQSYSAGSQNWSLDMDKQGFVYVANNNGMMVFDGVRWKLYPVPSRTIIRSVSVADNKRIYVGSFEEFGYWQADASQELKYHSLIPLLKGFTFHNHEIWKIVQVKNKVYFQGFFSLFVYDQKTVKSIQLPESIVFLLKANNRLFAQAIQGTLYELINDTFVKIENSNILFGTEVKTILPYRNGSFLIGTASKGVFLFDGKTIAPWNVPANPLLKEYQINNGILFGGKIVFGTIVKGVLILDSAGNVLNHLHGGNDLQNNTVLSLCNDNDQSIWVGLDNGIDNISFSKPVDLYPGRNEALGAVYTAALSGNILYVGTNRGIFTYKKVGNRFDFIGYLQNSQGQVWQLKMIDGTLFCGHDGTSIIQKKSLQRISDVNGGYSLVKIMHKGIEYLIQSTYSSLVIYKKASGKWVFSHQVKGFIEPARFIATDHLGNIWVGHLMKGLYRLRLSESMDSVAETQVFNQKNGLPSDANIRVFKVEDRVVFSNGEKLFTWDDLKQKIIPFDDLNSKLDGFQAATSISPVGNNQYWFTTKTEAALINIKGNVPVILYRIILDQYNLTLVDGYENIVPLNENLHLICLDNGFAIFDKSYLSSLVPDHSTLIIRDLYCWDAGGTRHSLPNTGKSIKLSHSNNNLAISFASLRNPCSRKLFQFMLLGIDGGWGKWSEVAEAKYTRLPRGKYTFKVRTLTSNGSVTEAVSLQFIVRPAWFASNLAAMLYVLFAIGGILVSQYFYRKRIIKHHEHLRLAADEKSETDKRQAEQEIVKLHNEKLQTEISHKNMQLADSTMAMMKKNEVLIEIKSELEKQKEELGTRYPARYLQRLTTLIDKNISNDNDWEIFESLFDQAHENFFKRIKQSFPDLTQSDLKLCAYLKLNLSSKEIAPLLNISIRGVEIRRYRLRKRLALASDDNLVAFIMKF